MWDPKHPPIIEELHSKKNLLFAAFFDPEIRLGINFFDNNKAETVTVNSER